MDKRVITAEQLHISESETQPLVLHDILITTIL